MLSLSKWLIHTEGFFFRISFRFKSFDLPIVLFSSFVSRHWVLIETSCWTTSWNGTSWDCWVMPLNGTCCVAAINEINCVMSIKRNELCDVIEQNMLTSLNGTSCLKPSNMTTWVTSLNGTCCVTSSNVTSCVTSLNGTSCVTSLNGTSCVTSLNGTCCVLSLNGMSCVTSSNGKKLRDLSGRCNFCSHHVEDWHFIETWKQSEIISYTHWYIRHLLIVICTISYFEILHTHLLTKENLLTIS